MILGGIFLLAKSYGELLQCVLVLYMNGSVGQLPRTSR